MAKIIIKTNDPFASTRKNAIPGATYIYVPPKTENKTDVTGTALISRGTPLPSGKKQTRTSVTTRPRYGPVQGPEVTVTPAAIQADIAQQGINTRMGRKAISPAQAQQMGYIKSDERARLEQQKQTIVVPKMNYEAMQEQKRIENVKQNVAMQAADTPMGQLYYSVRGNIPGVIGDIVEWGAAATTEGIYAANKKERQKATEFIRGTIIEKQEDIIITGGDKRSSLTIPGEFGGVSTNAFLGNVGGGALAVGAAVVPAAGALIGAGFTGISYGKVIENPTPYNIASAGIMTGLMVGPEAVGKASKIKYEMGKLPDILGKRLLYPKVTVMEYGPRSLKYTFKPNEFVYGSPSVVGNRVSYPGRQSFIMVKQEPGYIRIERSFSARIGITKPKITDIKPTKETLAWNKAEVTVVDLNVGRMRTIRLVRGIQKRDTGGETMRRSFRTTVFDRQADFIGIAGGKSGIPTRGGGRIYDISDVLGGKPKIYKKEYIQRLSNDKYKIIKAKNAVEAKEKFYSSTYHFKTESTIKGIQPRFGGSSEKLTTEMPIKDTITTGGRSKLMLRTKLKDVPKIEAVSETRTEISAKSILGERTRTNQDLLTRTRFNIGIASLSGTRSRQAQAFRTRQAFRTASLLGNVPVPALTTRSLLSSRQITRTTTAPRPEERLGLASPLLMPPRLRLAAPIMPGFGGGRSLGSPRLTFGRNYKYAPSLAGIFSGKTIRKAPKGTLTGLEIRYPVRRRI